NLHLASGGNPISGWVNIDVSSKANIRMDLRRHLPLSDASAVRIFCEHYWEHIAYPRGVKRFLMECCRVLAPGGRARFVLHDGEDLMRAYLARDSEYFEVAEQ